jgi:hypothetical protein
MPAAAASVEETEEFLLSCRYGELDEVRQYVDTHGPDAIVSARDNRGNTALHMCCANGHVGKCPPAYVCTPGAEQNRHNTTPPPPPPFGFFAGDKRQWIAAITLGDHEQPRCRREGARGAARGAGRWTAIITRKYLLVGVRHLPYRWRLIYCSN